MKKSKLSVGLVASFVGALAMTACNSSTSKLSVKDGSLVELVDYNNGTIEIKTDDLYGEYSDSSSGTKLYYDAILEALIRYEYPKLENVGMKSFATLEEEANDKVASSKETASDNASSNGTTYAEEWQKILDSHDCEDENDLKQYYLYDLEKEELSSWYAKNNIDTLKDEYLGVADDWNLISEEEKVEDVNSLYPYHILHVLVTLSADKANYVRGTITEAEASKLWQVVRELIDGSYSFEEVAYNLSDDTGSKSAYGDVGIMSTKTSFYNEFKLGIYAYDAILSGINSNNAKTADIYNAFGLADEAKVITETTSVGITEDKVIDLIQEEMVTNVKTPVGAFTTIPTVPYSVFKMIGEVAKDNKVGGLSPEAGDVALPRNVLYNQFLNFHSPFLITAEDISVADLDNFDDDVVNVVDHDFSDTTPGNFYIKNANFFVEMNVNGVNKKVLSDKNGNVVIGVRSEAGIHFMIMRKSIFEETNKSVVVDNVNGITKADQSLQNYYTTSIPTDEDYPGGETYVNMKATNDQTYYKGRSDDIKNELKSTNFDAAYDYRLYEYLINNDLVKGKITFPEGIEENIKEYIKRLRETKVDGDADSINEAWQNYLLMLRYQNSQRDFDDALLPNTCAFTFNDTTHNDEFKEGGRCYVNK